MMALERLIDLILLRLDPVGTVPVQYLDMEYSGSYFLRQYADQKYDMYRAPPFLCKTVLLHGR